MQWELSLGSLKKLTQEISNPESFLEAMRFEVPRVFGGCLFKPMAGE